MNFYEQKRGFDSILTRERIKGARSDTTKIALIADTNIEVEVDASTVVFDSGVHLSFAAVDFGELKTWVFPLLTLSLLASVWAFVYANVVYTPEILEGARDLKRSEREVEIRKLLKAVQSHEKNGNEFAELRVPLETAVGKTLEDYVAAVLEPDSVENSTALFTASDIELATMLKQRI
jgi:hypothetical protein